MRTSAFELVAYGLSERRLGYVALILAFGFDIFDQVGEDARSLSPALFVAAVLASFGVAWILAGAQSLLRHHRFSLVRHGDVLVTEEGLTTRRRIEIPVRKVQLVRIDQPLVRRFLGFATVLVETAGLGVQDGRLRQAEAVLPMVADEDLDRIVQAAAPIAAVAPASLVLHPAHPRALVRGVLGRMMRVVFFAAITGAVFFPWGFLALLLAPLTVPVAWLDWRTQGWLVTPVAVVCRRGFFLRRTWVVARDKLQSVHVAEGPLSRGIGLARVIVRVAGTTVSLPEVALADGLAIHEELARASEEEQSNGGDAGQHAHQIGEQARGQSVSRARDPDAPEVHGEDVERRFRRSVDRAGQVPDVAVGAVRLHDVRCQRERPRAAEGTQQRHREDFRRQPDGHRHRGEERDDGAERTRGAEHSRRREDRHHVRDDHDARR